MGTVDTVRTVVATLLVGLIAVNIALFVVHHASARVEPVTIAAPSDHERLEAMGRVLKAQQERLDAQEEREYNRTHEVPLRPEPRDPIIGAVLGGSGAPAR